MSEQTLKFGDIVVNKKEFNVSEQAIDINKKVVSDKFKHSNGGPQMGGYTKYFDNGEKNMSFKIEDEIVYLKYTAIWKKIKKSLDIRFHTQPIYDGKYIKNKVKTFSSMINTLFSDNEIPKERNHYLCIPTLCNYSAVKVDKKNYPQVYLEQYKYKIKRRKPEESQ